MRSECPKRLLYHLAVCRLRREERAYIWRRDLCDHPTLLIFWGALHFAWSLSATERSFQANDRRHARIKVGRI